MSASEKKAHDWSRRNFLRAVGAGVPTVKLLFDAPSAGGEANDTSPSYDPRKFTPIDLSHLFNSSPEDFGSRRQARELSGECSEDGLVHTPRGEQTFRGIPFLLGPQRGKCWVVLSTHAVARRQVISKFPLGDAPAPFALQRSATGIRTKHRPPARTVTEQVGQCLAALVLSMITGAREFCPFDAASRSAHLPSLGVISALPRNPTRVMLRGS